VLGERTGLAVHLQDERLTSFEADGRMAQSGRTHAGKKRIRDAIAAAALLEDYFSSEA
jgi:putative Holliday junction resolvase